MNNSTGKISCHTAWGSEKPVQQLKNALTNKLKDDVTETTYGLNLPTMDLQKAVQRPTAKSEATNKAVATKPNVIKGKPVGQKPEIKLELKRGSMKDKWGVRLVYQPSQQGGLNLAVVKVTNFTASHRAKLLAGDKILTINGWQIDTMDEPQVIYYLIFLFNFFINFC